MSLEKKPDLLDVLSEAWKSTPQSDCHFVFVSPIDLERCLSYWLLMAMIARLAFITAAVRGQSLLLFPS